jgi:hypothetical protein
MDQPPAPPEAPATPDVSPPPTPEASPAEAAPPAPPAPPAEPTFQQSAAPAVTEATKDYPACSATVRDQCTNAGQATKKKARKRR